MADVWNTFQSCGGPAWLCLLFGILGGALGIGALLVAALGVPWARTAGMVALIVALSPVLVGVLGRLRGRAIVESVLASGAIDPAREELIRQQGYLEADSCVVVGGTCTVLPLVLSVAALGLAFTRTRDDRALT
jgi:hypothetical protein